MASASTLEVPGIIARLHHQRYEGQVVLRSGPLWHRIVLRNGLITGARVEGEFLPLGRLLLQEGRISRRSLQLSLERMATTSRLQGQLLCELGAMTHTDLQQALRRQLSRRVLRLLALGSAQQTALVSAARSAHPLPAPPLHPLSLIREHIGCLSPAKVRAELEALAAKHPRGRLTLNRQAIPATASLEPWERRVLLELREPFTLAGLGRKIPLLRLVLYLATIGALDPGHEAEESWPDRRMEQAARLLGVSRDLDQTRLKHAYRRCVMEVHPDRHPAATAWQKERLEARFVAFQRAYELLRAVAAGSTARAET